MARDFVSDYRCIPLPDSVTKSGQPVNETNALDKQVKRAKECLSKGGRIMARILIQPRSSDNLKSLVALALENQLRVLSAGISKTKSKLADFETENGITSSVFYERYEEGKMGDDPKYIRWAGEYETLKKLEKDYHDLQGIELCS